MNNSILSILVSTNSTFLGIIVAGALAFFIYSYQELNQNGTRLDDLRTETAKIMKMPLFVQLAGTDYSNYVLKDGTADFKSIDRDLFTFSFNQESPSSQNEIRNGAIRILTIINLLSNSYPYTGDRKVGKISQIATDSDVKRIDYDPEWEKDLIELNHSWLWTFRQRKDVYIALLREYKKLEKKEAEENFLEQCQSAIQKAQDRGETLSLEEARRKLATWSPSPPKDYEMIVQRFFDRLSHIQEIIVPKLRDASFKFNLIQNKFNTKRWVTHFIIFSIWILIFGIFIPMFVQLYSKSPHIKAIELTLAVLTILPYLLHLLWFLKVALYFKFR